MKKLWIICYSFLLFFSACNYMGKSVRGNGKVTQESRNVSTFEGLSIVGDMDVYFEPGSSYNVRVEADENLMPYIETEKDGSSLRIGTKEGYNLNTQHTIKVYVTAPTLRDLEVIGSGNFSSSGAVASPDHLKIDVTGSGSVKMEVNTPEVAAEISGSGDVILKGSTRTFNADLNGSGNIRCFDLMSESTDVDISGSGDAEVYASKKLEMDINGSGGVAYKGNPAAVKQNVSGSGDVRKAD